MIKAIVFDVDGVLIHPEKLSKKLSYYYNIPEEKTKTFFEGIFQQCMIGEVDIKKELPSHLKEWGWKSSLEDFMSYWLDTEYNLDKDLIAFIEGLKDRKIKCYLGTNQDKHRLDYIIERLGFKRLLDGVFSSCHLGYLKPQKEFFEKMVEDLKLEKDEILFWDDREENVKSAKEVGINGEVYTDFQDFRNKMDKYLSLT